MYVVEKVFVTCDSRNGVKVWICLAIKEKKRKRKKMIRDKKRWIGIR